MLWLILSDGSGGVMGETSLSWGPTRLLWWLLWGWPDDGIKKWKSGNSPVSTPAVPEYWRSVHVHLSLLIRPAYHSGLTGFWAPVAVCTKARHQKSHRTSSRYLCPCYTTPNIFQEKDTLVPFRAVYAYHIWRDIRPKQRQTCSINIGAPSR